MEKTRLTVTDQVFAHAKEIVAGCMEEAGIHLSEKEACLLTEDIMETVATMGGDLTDENMISVSNNYIENHFYPRFLKLHRRELGGSSFRY